MPPNAADPEPTRADVDATRGDLLLEFGSAWCGFCRAAQPGIAAATASMPELRHLKIEDGPGKPLGRSFRVKLWPTLVALKDGVEVGRVVRPRTEADVAAALAPLASPAR
jgi:thioredoxin 1